MIANDPQNDAKTQINALIQIANGYMPDVEKANQALQKIIERNDADIETKARIKLQIADNLLKQNNPNRTKIAQTFFEVAYDQSIKNTGFRLNAFDKGIQQLIA